MVAALKKLNPLNPCYRGWKQEFLNAFKDINLEQGQRGEKYQQGYVARVVTLTPNVESYVVVVRYDLNHNQNAIVRSWEMVVVKMVNEMKPEFGRCPHTNAPLEFDSGRMMANCVIKFWV